jgi:hypothetical protein
MGQKSIAQGCARNDRSAQTFNTKSSQRELRFSQPIKLGVAGEGVRTVHCAPRTAGAMGTSASHLVNWEHRAWGSSRACRGMGSFRIVSRIVSCGLGVAFVSRATRWRCPENVVLLPVTDLKLPLQFALIWQKDNDSLLLAKFVADVKLWPEVEEFAKR